MNDMDVNEQKFQLLKINLGILGAALTAITFEVPRNVRFAVIGLGAIGLSVSYLYLDLMPGFSFEWFETEWETEESWDTVVLLGFMGILFLVVSFSAPSLEFDLVQLVPSEAARVATLFLASIFLGIVRILSVGEMDGREITKPYIYLLSTAYLTMLIVVIAVMLNLS